jgi:hypothetical protein
MPSVSQSAEISSCLGHRAGEEVGLLLCAKSRSALAFTRKQK